MTPAYSVIFFTTASGAGYGILVWLIVYTSILRAPGSPILFAIAFALALSLVSAGLLASLAHLGHPERAWRSFSQWRSSWLSREGVLALASFPPALTFAAARLFADAPAALGPASGVLGVLLALATVAATGMIYASLKPIPRWHNGWVAPVYLAFALASGALWLHPFLLLDGVRSFAPLTAVIVAVAWILKWLYWRRTDAAAPTVTIGSALGLGPETPAQALDPPGTAGNFVLEEMGYRIARKHATRLRRIALGLAASSVLATLPAQFAGPAIAIALALVALLCGMSAILIERWLFFAEARHIVSLYFDARAT